MTDFDGRTIVRFRSKDLEILGDFLEDMIELLGDDVEEDEKQVIENFLEALDEADSIEIVDDEEFLAFD